MQPDKAKADAGAETAITKLSGPPPPSSTAYVPEDEKARRARLKKTRDNEADFDKTAWAKKMRQRDEDSRLAEPHRFPGEPEGGYTPIASVRAGIVMMGLAVVWFFASSYFRGNGMDSLILLAMGIITFIRGVMQRQRH
jgi:hypothetical protein